MSTFTIDAENNIMSHAELPAGADESQAFSSAKELAKLTAEWPVSRLIDTWDSFAGVAPFDKLKPVKKFTSRGAAVARIWKVIARISPFELMTLVSTKWRSCGKKNTTSTSGICGCI